jgi:Icc-related predicted phosphoesterase
MSLAGLLRRRAPHEPATATTRLYYASDIHGTETLWRKFLGAAAAYRAGVLVMGGDVAGKVVVPLLECEARNGSGEDIGWEFELFGQRELLRGEAQAAAAERRVRANGMYPHRMSAAEARRVAALPEDERERWFALVMLETFERWLALADERLGESGVRCFVMPGNDDPPGIDAALAEARRVEACDERVVEFDGHEMLSLGYSNITPFHSPRELDEDELYRRVERLAEQLHAPARAIFNLHVPPYDSTLDTAAELDAQLRVVTIGAEPKLIPVGSTAVRELIERYQPLLALHGHVHESPGAVHIGRTLCLNPGSAYHTGRISGCLVKLEGERVRHQFVTG